MSDLLNNIVERLRSNASLSDVRFKQFEVKLLEEKLNQQHLRLELDQLKSRCDLIEQRCECLLQRNKKLESDYDSKCSEDLDRAYECIERLMHEVNRLQTAAFVKARHPAFGHLSELFPSLIENDKKARIELEKIREEQGDLATKIAQSVYQENSNKDRNDS